MTTSQPTAIDAAASMESAERNARPLIRLAKASGVSTAYIDQLGAYTEISDDALVEVLAALGVDASSDDAIAASMAAIEERAHARLIPPTIVAITGEDTTVAINARADESTTVTAAITLEDGTTYRNATQPIVHISADGAAHAIIPADLPMGYHTLDVTAGERHAHAAIISAPARIPLPKAVAEHQRWGWMTQLYSVRSAASWGVGDYGDLRTLIIDAAHNGADFMLINPIHACAPITPLEPSPYLPESRRFLNVTYIRPQNIPEYDSLAPADRAEVDRLHASVESRNDDPNPMDINVAWDAKRAALKLIYRAGRSDERQAEFDRFKRAAGTDLDNFAIWCLCFEELGRPWDAEWFGSLTTDSPEVRALVAEHPDEVDFTRWLQWIADEQVTDAQHAAKGAGMALGLMQDMAVGVHTFGSDVWASPERFAGGVSVGCPPDFYNQQGQDWGQPPFDPNHLEETGYATYREMVHNVFSHAGAVRIDHVLGLFRLWWIPAGHTAKDGAYLMYDHDAMLSVLTIEATRADGMVIGEDLGTVPDTVRRVLADRGVLGTVVEWFARVDDSPNAGDPYAHPSTWRRQALASVTTHDLPPTAGYLEFEHVKLRERLHLLAEPVEAFQKSATAERQAMLDLLVSGGWLGAEAAADVPAHEQEIVEAMHAMMLDSPSLLLQAALVDGVGEHRSQNQPGTSTEYSNWRVPLADEHGHVVHTDEVFSLPRVQSLCAVMRGEK